MSNHCLLELYFVSGDSPELIKTRFLAPSYSEFITGLRGCNVPQSAVPFKWGTASHALSLFFVKSVEFFLDNRLDEMILEGKARSPANTIANLLYKRPTCWVLDLFGVDTSGRSLLKRPILCCNALKRRPGPIQVFFRKGLCNPERIRIFCDDIDITEDREVIKGLRENLELSWQPGGYTNVSNALAA